MRLDADTKFWLVIDPTPDSEIPDIAFETTLRDFALQLKGGLAMDRHPTIFTSEEEAKFEALGRITAARAAEQILRAGRENPEQQINRVEVYGKDGKLVFEADLGDQDE